MSTFGLFGLVVAFTGVAVATILLLASTVLAKRGNGHAAGQLAWGGAVGALLVCAALTFCCGLMAYCFVAGDFSIEYVLLEHSDAEGVMGLLYRVSGLWAGQEGSLLLWAWLISAFNATVAVRVIKRTEALDSAALLVSNLVAGVFVGLLLFSEDNMPFIATAEPYVDAEGNLTAMASVVGMNSLLEHWAQAVHPPTLFIGYAGLTIPFAYALGTLIVNDASPRWVRSCNRYALFSWLFLGVGIGLGSIWAYVVLGWGGYWGWDPVENASLLSWMVALALVHSFTVYRQRGAFRRWGVMCACLAFAFVVMGTFITRSGLVSSVHAFAGDAVSLYLFLGLIAASLLAGVVGLAIRWKAFGQGDAIAALASKDAAYYLNNVIMIVFTFLLCYLTISSALPAFLPFGGQALSAGTYNAIARPIGILYCLIVAVCPLLAWGRTDRASLLRSLKVPAICAAVLFAVLMAYFATTLLPAYQATIALGGTEAQGLQSEGPAWYYNGLAVAGFAVASLLFFTTLCLIGRCVRQRAKAAGSSPMKAFFGMIASNAPRFGGYVAHLGMAVILVGLVGSSMYVSERVEYMAYEEGNETAAEPLVVDDYELRLTDSDIEEVGGGSSILYSVSFDVYDAATGAFKGRVEPSVELDVMTQQTKLNASVLGSPTEDLFVVYRGVNDAGELSLDVRVNPLISFVWIGFGMLVVGTAVASFGRRPKAAVRSAVLVDARPADKGAGAAEGATDDAAGDAAEGVAEDAADDAREDARG